MKKVVIIFLLILTSCTSNTIYKKPKDLIPKDTMVLLVQEMMIAASAKFIKNKNSQRNINYMPFVHKKYNIDSARFNNSNIYYMSKIDDYVKIFEEAKNALEQKKAIVEKLKKFKDSVRKDSLRKLKDRKKKINLDTVLQ